MNFSYPLEKEFYARLRSSGSGSHHRLEPYLRSLVAHPEANFGGKRVLEIGAGEALYSRMIAERFVPKQVVALDLVPAQLVVYQAENKMAGVLGVGGDCFYLPFRNQSFDVIFGSLVLHRFRELGDVVREMHRVLVDQGVYLGIEPSLRNLLHLYRQFFGDHSLNEFLLSGTRASQAFTQCGFQVQVRRLAPRFPFLCRLGLATCMGIVAKKY